MIQKIQYDRNFPDTLQNRAAVEELVELIRAHYPEATFEVAAAPEDSQVVHLYVTIDRVDTDELVDLVIEREMALQQQGVPIHTIPLRTPERDAEVREQVARERAHGSFKCASRVDSTCDLARRPAAHASPTRPGAPGGSLGRTSRPDAHPDPPNSAPGRRRDRSTCSR